MTSELEQGAANCVVDCAEVRKGQYVIIVNEDGAVDRDVSDAIAGAAERQGAKVSTVWAAPIPKDQPENIPGTVLEAYREADVLFAHYPSLQREALHAHFPSELRVRVPNRAPRTALLSSDWARFPYGLQRAISHALDARMAPGVRWRITSPTGTDISGTFAASDSVVSTAYFSVNDDNERARRNFPGGVHSPHASDRVKGAIVVDYLDHHPDVGNRVGQQRVVLQIDDNAVAGLSGDPVAAAVRADMEKRTDGYLDSWHGGVNPRTFAVVPRLPNARGWFGYAHCSPQVLHFHWGRSHAHINVGIDAPTVWIGDRAIYRDGRLLDPEDAAVDEAMARLGLDWRTISAAPMPSL